MSSSGINWNQVVSGLGSAIQGGVQGYQTPPGQGGQGREPGVGGGRGEVGQTPTAPTPRAPNMQAPMTGPIFFPTTGPTPPPGGWNTPTGYLPQIPLGQAGYGMPLAPMTFAEGGIVPHTGLYEVNGGEVIVPKRKVAKLHKGEKVMLPTRRPAALEGQFVGGFEDGGTVPVTAPGTSPGQPYDLGGPTLNVPGAWDPSVWSEQVPGQPTTKDKIKGLLQNLAKLPGTQTQQQGQRALGGPLQQLGARVGTVPAAAPPPPQYNLTGAMGGLGGFQLPQIPGAPQTPGIAPGLPPAAPGQPGGPLTYGQGVQAPPYQSQFIDKKERNQYIGQNVLAGVSNAILMHKQQQYDKTVQRAQGGATRQITLKQEAQQAQQNIQETGLGDPRAQGQANANMRPGAPGQPGQPPIPLMTNDERDTYDKLKRDPATQKQAEQFAKLIDRRNKQEMKDLEKAQTDPNSPEYRGYMMAQQQLMQQQADRMKMQQQVMQTATAQMQAQATFQAMQMQQQMMKQAQNWLNGPTGSRDLPENNPGGPFIRLGKMTPEEGTQAVTAMGEAASTGDLKSVFEAANKIASARDAVDKDPIKRLENDYDRAVRAGDQKAMIQARDELRELQGTKSYESRQTALQKLQLTERYNEWRVRFQDKTKRDVAQMQQNKAPAAIMQTAMFANSALKQLNTAETAFNDLRDRGVLGTIPADKMENWLFGKGLVDPTLPPDVVREIGQLRAALEYTSTAAMRAHTGRTSKEIYEDFTSTLGLGQSADALQGAFDQTRSLLEDYSEAASTNNIMNLRNPGQTPPSDTPPPSGAAGSTATGGGGGVPAGAVGTKMGTDKRNYYVDKAGNALGVAP